MNSYEIIGNLTRKPTLVKRNVGGVQTSVLNFTVAANYGNRQADGNRRVQYVNCAAFRGFAEKIAPYMDKGVKVFVRGTPRVSVYQSAQDHAWRASLEIGMITEFEFQSAAKGADGTDAPEDRMIVEDQPPAEEPDELPFA